MSCHRVGLLHCYYAVLCLRLGERHAKTTRGRLDWEPQGKDHGVCGERDDLAGMETLSLSPYRSLSLSTPNRNLSFIHSFLALDNHFTLFVPNMVVLRLLLDHNILSTTFLSSSSFTTITFQQGLYQFLCLSSYIASDQRTV